MTAVASKGMKQAQISTKECLESRRDMAQIWNTAGSFIECLTDVTFDWSIEEHNEWEFFRMVVYLGSCRRYFSLEFYRLKINVHILPAALGNVFSERRDRPGTESG